MNKGKTIFAQVMSLINTYEFKKCVNRYKCDRHAIKFTYRDQFMVMSFAQFTDSSGLRDIETTLNLCSPDLYRSGIKIMSKSTLAEANEKRIGVSTKTFHKLRYDKQRKHIRNRNLDLIWMKWSMPLTAALLSCV